MTAHFGWLERIDADALRTDQYLDALLAGAERQPRDMALPGREDPGSAVDAAIRAVVDDLAATAVRVHPSFRFEERLARRLADAAVWMRAATAAGAESASPIIAFPDPGQGADAGVQALPARGGAVRPLLVGGALTSAAISIAGAAFVAWRRARTAPFAAAVLPGAAGLPGAPARPVAGMRLRFDARRRLD